MDLAMDIDVLAIYCLKKLGPIDEVRRDIVKLLVEVAQLAEDHYESVQLKADFRIVFTTYCFIIWLLMDILYPSQNDTAVKNVIEEVKRRLRFGATHGKKYAQNLAKWTEQDLPDEKLREVINNYFCRLTKDQQRWRFVLSAVMNIGNALLENSKLVYQQGGYVAESIERQFAIQELLKKEIWKKLISWLPTIERHEKVLRPGSAWQVLCMLSTTIGLFAGYSSALIGYKVEFFMEWGIKIFDAGVKNWTSNENKSNKYDFKFSNSLH